MEYITKVLGVSVLRYPLVTEDRVNSECSLEYGKIDNLKCIFAKPKGQLSTINQIKEHFNSIIKIHNLPVVFEFESLSRQRASSFIDAKIPFVVLNRQIYLPFLGTYLSEKYSQEPTEPPKTMYPSSQMILFDFIYNKNRPFYINGLSKKFDISEMSVSRAATQLVKLNLLNEEKQGTLRILTSSLSPKELFDKALPYLINPIRTRLFVDKENLPKNIFASGKAVLGISEPYDCFGTIENIKNIASLPALIDSDKQCALEVWRYNPFILGKNNTPDILSLYMAYKDEEKAKHKLSSTLNKLWGVRKKTIEKTPEKAPEKQSEYKREAIPSYLL